MWNVYSYFMVLLDKSLKVIKCNKLSYCDEIMKMLTLLVIVLIL